MTIIKDISKGKGKNMEKDFDIIISTNARMEEEKQKFGGEFYKLSYRFPVISLSNDPKDYNNIDRMISRSHLVKLFVDNCGENITILFAEIYKIYELEEKEDYDHFDKLIIDTCTIAIAVLALAGKDCDDIINQLTNLDKENKNIEIIGSQYCFIVSALLEILVHYTSIFHFIMRKQYLGKKFVSDAQNVLQLLMSEEFEEMRKYFKVIECVESMKETRILH